MIDIEDQIVVRRIAPICAVERLDKRFLLPIALFYDLFGLRTIDIPQAHDTRNAVWQRRDNLNVKRSRDSRK